MDRYVRVPEGFRAVLVSKQLAEHYREWTLVAAPEPYAGIEVRVYDLPDDPAVLEVQARYTGAADGLGTVDA